MVRDHECNTVISDRGISQIDHSNIGQLGKVLKSQPLKLGCALGVCKDPMIQ